MGEIIDPSRYRTAAAIVERYQAGESIESIAADYHLGEGRWGGIRDRYLVELIIAAAEALPKRERPMADKDRTKTWERMSREYTPEHLRSWALGILSTDYGEVADMVAEDPSVMDVPAAYVLQLEAAAEPQRFDDEEDTSGGWEDPDLRRSPCPAVDEAMAELAWWDFTSDPEELAGIAVVLHNLYRAGEEAGVAKVQAALEDLTRDSCDFDPGDPGGAWDVWRCQDVEDAINGVDESDALDSILAEARAETWEAAKDIALNEADDAGAKARLPGFSRVLMEERALIAARLADELRDRADAERRKANR